MRNLIVSFKLIYPSIRANASRVIVFMLVSVFLTGMSILSPMITRKLINEGIMDGASLVIIWSAVGLGIIGILQQLVSLLSQSSEIEISQSIVRRLRKRLAEAVSWLTDPQSEDRDPGYMISRVQSDAQNLDTSPLKPDR